jgi:hypothetical protein
MMPDSSSPKQLRLATNLSAQQAAALGSGLSSPTTAVGFADADLIVLEARTGHAELTDDQAAVITERVRLGATLIVALSEARQRTSMRLGQTLASTTWQVSGQFGSVPPSGSILVGDADTQFFDGVKVAGRSFPFFFTAEPLAPEERGQSRYAGYARKIPVLGKAVEPGDQFWTRPLLLRDVKVRMRGNNNAATPLLATARYGAGRTVLFGSGFDQLTAAPSLLPSVLAWLKPKTITKTDGQLPQVKLDLAYGRRSLILKLSSDATVPVEVVGRAYTWENAPLGFEHDLMQAVTLTPGKTVELAMHFPEPSSTAYQALGHRDAFRVRMAVLGADGAATLVERQLLADFTPQVTLDVEADDVNHWTYPFHAPGPNFQRSANDRMGARFGAYAYPPGAKVSGAVTLANGLRDLGPLAVVADETTPGNPSAYSLVDGAIIAGKRPLDSINAYSMWSGKPGVENTLTFTFPHPVTLASITLVGDFRTRAEQNPDAASLQLDGKKIASGSDLIARFLLDSGNVRFEFEPATGTQVRITIPAPPANTTARRRGVALTEVLFEGWTGPPPAAISGDLIVTLEDAHTGSSTPILRETVTLKPGERRVIAHASTLPTGSGAPEFYRLQASFNGQTQSVPVMALTPPSPLPPISDLVPPDAPSLGFIVTEGFRNCFPLGTGVAERVPGAWASPDDLIWAYSRQMKEVGPKARTLAARLYVTEGDMRHYSSGWRTFGNGIPQFTEATPNLVSAMSKLPHWNTSQVAHLGFSDRWDTGPQVVVLNGWQDYVEFDAHLRATGKPPLTGRTREELSTEIHTKREDEWQAWQLGQYLDNLSVMKSAFAAKDKRLLITAQGCPVIAGPAGAEVAEIVQGMSDDCSWGMAESSVSLTTGRQLAESTHNPVWKMSTLLQYGYNSSILNSPEWHSPVGTLEPSRRQYYDRAWRATIWNDGTYRSPYFAGYGENAGISYQITQNDWVEWWRIEERHSLIRPEQPIGAGLVMSTIRFADPNHTRFTAGNVFDASTDALALARAFQRLHDASLSLPFAANATALAKWTGSAPLIILLPEVFSEEEIATLEKLQARGIRMVAFTTAPSLPARRAALFSQPGTLIQTDPAQLTSFEATQLVPAISKRLDIPLTFAPGVSGYGFTMSGTQFVVIEDCRNLGRRTTVRLRATESKRTAVASEVNTHTPISVQRIGRDWVFDVDLRPGDAQLVALREG